jgi:hypothetical protein
MKIGRLEITASRFPNQGYGWFPHKNGKGPKAVLNPSGARFGGGWAYKLGVSVGMGPNPTILVDLLFGIIRIKVNQRVPKAPKANCTEQPKEYHSR